VFLSRSGLLQLDIFSLRVTLEKDVCIACLCTVVSMTRLLNHVLFTNILFEIITYFVWDRATVSKIIYASTNDDVSVLHVTRQARILFRLCRKQTQASFTGTRVTVDMRNIHNRWRLW
jgi:hypothetical protein